MTTLAILNGDFEILFDDETVGTATTGMRMIRRAAGASATVYTTLQLYSAVADAADEFQAMGFRNPMLPVTPNAFTLENKYFMPRSSTEWLKEGTISADWSYTALPDTIGNGVVAVAWSGGTGPVTGDIGRLITQGDTGDTGTLLDFETAPDGTTYVWIRPDDSTPVTGDLFDGTGTLIVTGGTMSATTSTAGLIGNTRYTAIQAIGAVPFATEVYVYQNRIKLTDSAGGFQWWTTDPNVSLGIISVLIRTHFQGVGFTTVGAIADADLEVFARRYTSLYDNFRLNVAGGGFSALPLASSPDINNTTGYQTMTGSGGSGTFLAGELCTESTTGAQVVLTAVSGTTANPILEYYIVGDLTDIAGTNTLTGATSGATCTTAAPTANSGGPTDATSGEGGTVTITIGSTTADFDGNGTAEPYSVTVNAQTNVPVAKVYERLKYVTRRGQDNTFWNTVATSVPGEAYRGIEALYYYDNPVGTFTQGDDITGQLGYTARVFGVNSGATGEDVNQAYITVTDQQTSLDSVSNNDVLTDEGSDTVTADNAGAGGAFLSITSPKASPFGTFTGTTIFGAQGVLFTGIDLNPQAYTLTDDLGTLRPPPNTVTILVDNTLALDRVLVARDTGLAGVIDKDQFGGMTATGISATSITVGGTVDSEVPAAGWVRVVAVDEQQEHRYKYDSRTTGASGVFTLTPITPGTATAGTSDTELFDTGATFVTEGAEVGMLVYVAGRTSTYEVTDIQSETNVGLRLLYGAGGFVSTDTYTMNETIQAYDTGDDIFDLIIDAEATTTSYSNTIVKTPAANFGVVVNVRQGKVILPFTQNATVGDSGLTVTTVRQDDTIAI
jgi:hypothetical protein